MTPTGGGRVRMCRMEQARAGSGTVPELQWAAQHRRVQPSTPAPLLQGPCFRSPSSPHLAAVWGPPRLRGPERMTLLGAPTGGGEGECHLGWHFAHHPCTHLTLTSHHLPHSGGVVRGGTRATGFHRGPRALSSPTPCLPFCRGLLGQPSGRSSSRRTAGCTFGERFPGFHGFSPAVVVICPVGRLCTATRGTCPCAEAEAPRHCCLAADTEEATERLMGHALPAKVPAQGGKMQGGPSLRSRDPSPRAVGDRPHPMALPPQGLGRHKLEDRWEVGGGKSSQAERHTTQGENSELWKLPEALLCQRRCSS